MEKEELKDAFKTLEILARTGAAFIDNPEKALEALKQIESCANTYIQDLQK